MQQHPRAGALLQDADAPPNPFGEANGRAFRGVLLLGLLCALLFHSTALAQSSATSISFQGLLNGANGQPLPNGIHVLTFRFYSTGVGGAPVGTTDVTGVPVTNGQVNVAIPVQPAWFDGSTRYLGITVAGQNGGIELAPRVLVTAVPHALRARSLIADSGEEVLFNSAGMLGINTSHPVDSLHIAPSAMQAAREVCFLTIGPGGDGVTQLSMGVRGFVNGRAEIQAFKRGNVVGEEGDLLLNPGGGRVIVGENRATDLIVFGTTRTTVVQITSDRHAKTGFQPVDVRAVLDKVVTLPLSIWSYTNRPAISHLGPVAQDFAAFGLGEDDKHIATVDADGVLFASVQALHQLVREKDAKIRDLERRLEALEQRMESRFAAQERH